MTDTTPPNDVARCPGRHDTLHGEFGSVANPQCIGCARRVPVILGDGKRWMTVPVMNGKCQERIFNTEGN